MLVAAVARAVAAMRRLVVAVDHVSRAEAPCSNDMPNVKSKAGRSGLHTTRELHAKQRQLQAQKSHANRLPSNLYRKTSNSGRTSELLLGEPAREKASRPELDIEELDALPGGSLEYEVKAIAGRIQAPIGRATVNIGEMTAVPTPTIVG
jgi:hypothetical protein